MKVKRSKIRALPSNRQIRGVRIRNKVGSHLCSVIQRFSFCDLPCAASATNHHTREAYSSADQSTTSSIWLTLILESIKFSQSITLCVALRCVDRVSLSSICIFHRFIILLETILRNIPCVATYDQLTRVSFCSVFIVINCK